MIINTHNKICYQQQCLESTNSNREQQTNRLAKLSFLCSMMVDEHITILFELKRMVDRMLICLMQLMAVLPVWGK